MNRSTSNCWPTHQQELLLKACLFKDQSALEAWQSWNAQVDLNTIDHGSHRLLPLLYKNLEKFNIESIEWARIKGVFKRTWFQNQLLFRHAQSVISVLLDLGLEVMLLKGVAMFAYYYQDYGIRPMDDFDIMVKESDSQKAIQKITELGWIAEQDILKDYHPLYHAASFVNSFKSKVDLHWYLCPQDIGSDNESGYWARAIKGEFAGLPIKILSPADQLIHTCVHGTRWDQVPPIRWVADAYEIIRKEENHLDWDHLIAHSRLIRVSAIMLESLTYLKNTFDANIPDAVLFALEQIPKSPLEIWSQKISSKNLAIFSHFVNNRVLWYWLYVRGNYPFPGFFRYLKELWSVHSVWQVPFEGLKRGIQKFKVGILTQASRNP